MPAALRVIMGPRPEASVPASAGIASATAASYGAGPGVRSSAGNAAATGNVRSHATQVPGLPLVQGYGKDWATGLGTGSYTVSVTSGTGAGSFPAAVAWLNAGNQGTITFASAGPFDLGRGNHYIRGRSNFFIDGRGVGPTLQNGALFIHNGCHHFAIANIRIRNEALVPGDSAFRNDCIEIWTDTAGGPANHDFALINVSASGGTDETISLSSYAQGNPSNGSYNVTFQDCIMGTANRYTYLPYFGDGSGTAGSGVSQGFKADDTRHDYGSVVYGNWHVSYVRCVYATDSALQSVGHPNGYDGMYNRCPLVSYSSSGAPAAANSPTLDITNMVWINAGNTVQALDYAVINNRQAYRHNVSRSGEPSPSNGSDRISGGAAISYTTDYSSGYTVASTYQVAAVGTLPGVLSAAAGATYVKTYGGCLPHDSIDTALLSDLP